MFFCVLFVLCSSVLVAALPLTRLLLLSCVQNHPFININIIIIVVIIIIVIVIVIILS